MTTTTIITIDHDAEFTLPAIGAHSTGAHVDEDVSVRYAPIAEGVDGEVLRNVRIDLARFADNDPQFDVGLLDYRLRLLCGEETERGWGDVISFDLDQAERFARMITTAVAAARADFDAHSYEFVTGAATVAR